MRPLPGRSEHCPPYVEADDYGKEGGVEPIEHAAVRPEDRARVLGVRFALERALEKVTERRDQGRGEPQEEGVGPVSQSRYRPTNQPASDPDENAVYQPLPGLCRREGRARASSTPERPATEVRRRCHRRRSPPALRTRIAAPCSRSRASRIAIAPFRSTQRPSRTPRARAAPRTCMTGAKPPT